MTTTLNASTAGAGGFIATSDNSGVLALQTAGTTAITVDASQNVGIGTTSPSTKLEVASPAATPVVLRLASNKTGTGSGDKGRLDFYSADNSGTAYQLGYMDCDRSDGTGTASYIAWANRVSGTVAERMRITSGGNVSIATSGAGITTSGSYALNLGTNGSVSQFAINTSGALAFGTPPNGTFAALSWYSANGQMYANTSSLRYKTNVETYTEGLETIKKLRPVTFKYINEGVTLEDEPVNAGFIAEEMDALGLKDFVIYKEINGQQVPDSLKYQNMCVLYVNAIQEMSILIEELKSINDTQAETINALTARIVALESKP